MDSTDSSERGQGKEQQQSGPETEMKVHGERCLAAVNAGRRSFELLEISHPGGVPPSGSIQHRAYDRIGTATAPGQAPNNHLETSMFAGTVSPI
jgi:hypothetical protein